MVGCFVLRYLQCRDLASLSLAIGTARSIENKSFDKRKVRTSTNAGAAGRTIAAFEESCENAGGKLDETTDMIDVEHDQSNEKPGGGQHSSDDGAAGTELAAGESSHTRQGKSPSSSESRPSGSQGEEGHNRDDRVDCHDEGAEQCPANPASSSDRATPWQRNTRGGISNNHDDSDDSNIDRHRGKREAAPRSDIRRKDQGLSLPIP